MALQHFPEKYSTEYHQEVELKFIPIGTRVIHPPKDDIWDILDHLSLQDGDIIFITSKILAIHQGRTVPMGNMAKDELIAKEATCSLPYEHRGGFHGNLTITDNVLIPAAGIDESNGNGYYILWPKAIDEFCHEIRSRLIKQHGLSRLGVVATDSHTMPLRWGVTGITIGLAGLEPLRDIRGHRDIFGREIKVTQIDLIDPLTAMAVLLMGETTEQTPIVILRGYEGVTFGDTGSMEHFKISPEMDLYQPLLDVFRHQEMKITLVAVTSADGFIADSQRNGDFSSKEEKANFREFLHSEACDGFICGRKTAEEFAGRLTYKPLFVLTHSRDIFKEMKQANIKSPALLGGLETYRYFLERDLVDFARISVEKNIHFRTGLKLDLGPDFSLKNVQNLSPNTDVLFYEKVRNTNNAF